MNIRFVPASLNITFEEVTDMNRSIFRNEYNTLNEYENDDIKEWVSKLKAQGKLDDTDRVLLTLLIELHKKIDNIETILKNNENKSLKLQHSSKIVGIHFDHIQINDFDFLENNLYFAKIQLPVFPKREIPIYLLGLNSTIAKIHMISQKNQDDWNSLVMAKEREEIRKIKGSIA